MLPGTALTLTTRIGFCSWVHICCREGHITLELTDAMPSFDEVVQAAREQREPEGWSEDPYEVRIQAAMHSLTACAKGCALHSPAMHCHGDREADPIIVHHLPQVRLATIRDAGSAS
jgi:hypothetical protein